MVASPLTSARSGSRLYRDRKLSLLCLFVLQNRLQYHTSAIIASALDTITLRHRLRKNPCHLSDLVDPMSLLGRRVASASLALPLPIRTDSFLLDTLESWYGPLWTSLTPRCKADPDCIQDKVWMQSVVIRGVTDSQLKR